MHRLIVHDCPEHLAHEISQMLEDNQALSVTHADAGDMPIYEPEIGTTPLWPTVQIEAIFDTDETLLKAHLLLKSFEENLKMTASQFENENWVEKSLSHFKPIVIGNTLCVCPTWLIPPTVETVVHLDPGLAFGTGTHATTYLCLTWLCKHRLPQSLIDYGCGSGILGISALKLGVKKIYAVDIDEQALLATQSNAELNGVADSMIISEPNSLNNKVPLIMANILLSSLIDLKNNFIELLLDEGELVLSGLLHDQVEKILEHYAKEFQVQNTLNREEWSLIHLKRKA